MLVALHFRVGGDVLRGDMPVDAPDGLQVMHRAGGVVRAQAAAVHDVRPCGRLQVYLVVAEDEAVDLFRVLGDSHDTPRDEWI